MNALEMYEPCLDVISNCSEHVRVIAGKVADRTQVPTRFWTSMKSFVSNCDAHSNRQIIVCDDNMRLETQMIMCFGLIKGGLIRAAFICSNVSIDEDYLHLHPRLHITIDTENIIENFNQYAAAPAGFPFLANEQLSSNCENLPWLTPREHEVATLMCGGYSNKHMARALDVSPRTIEVHRARVIEKLQAENSTRAILTYIRLAKPVIPPPP